MNTTEALKAGIEYGFLDSSIIADGHFKPTLLVNDPDRGEKVLTSIISELATCDEFFFSVAFITEGGVETILQTLREISNRGIKGKIIASQYQNFTQPKALQRLLRFPNIELRIVREENMHTKGYIFRHGTDYVSIVGSSNLTQNALCENREWNVKLISSESGKITQETIQEFNRLFDIATPVNDAFLEEYRKIYVKNRQLEKESEKAFEDYEAVADIGRIKPNKMQVAALGSLEALRQDGKDRALLISATGTGKTYLAAFDVAKVNPDRCLFIIHREQIAKDAMRSFFKVIGNTHSMAVLSGSSKDLDADYIFSTIQTLSKDSTLSQIAPDTFDYVIIDEVHRAGAPSYQKVLHYLKPKFILGMTATPERSDDFDIFELFDHNIAYEIRLQDAMREKMICPFHYFGIVDQAEDFAHMVSDERVRHILYEADFYGYSGDRVKGLIFCSRNDEAAELSTKFNQHGLRTVALSGSNTQEEREEAVERLEKDEGDDCLDYIFTVDIFNEGVDIPAVNQIIMLRPTESAIIFVQQLGRGLRLYDDKEFVVVLDFIGSYTKNFLIPVALSGDRTYNKDTVRKYIASPNQVVPGCSTIHFDPITQERIYESIDAANFNDVRLIKSSYQQLRYKLGRIPTLRDFDRYGEIDPIRIFENKSLGSYHKFLSKYEKEYSVRLTKEQEEVLKFVSMKFGAGKRPHELVVLKHLMEAPDEDPVAYLHEVLESQYGIQWSEHTEVNVVNVLTNQFSSGSDKKTYENCVFIGDSRSGAVPAHYEISSAFQRMLRDSAFRESLGETIDFALYRWRKQYSDGYKDTAFNLYKKYTYEDVCRLLEWDVNVVPLNIGGYKYDPTTKTYPVFINYEKADDISDTIRYDNHFVTPSQLIAISKSGRTPESDDVDNALHADERGIQMDLFVRKNKDDKISKEFYYLGRIHATGRNQLFTMENTDKTAVKIEYMLEEPVREDLYKYIVE